MSDTEELLLVGGIDQSIAVETKDLFDQIDILVAEATEAGNPNSLFERAATLLKTGRLAALGLSKVLFEIKLRWQYFNREINESFEDYAALKLGLSTESVTRYCRVQDMLQSGDVPGEVASQLVSRPIKDLVAISNTWASGYEIKKEDWKTLAKATDNNEVLTSLREIKGVEPRKNSMVLRLTRDGSIMAYQNNQQVFVGYLEIDKSEENELLKKAIERIISNGGILRE